MMRASPSTLRFGTAGIPLSTPQPNTLNGITHNRKLGLECMELEFVHGISVSEELAPQIKTTAQQQDITLTCHSPYFINLNAIESKKRGASKHRILEACRRLDQCGGWSACFHAGYYLGQEKESVYLSIKKAIKEIVATLQSEGIKLWLRPELTGKPTQWGDLQEIVRLASEVEQVLPCIDFAHHHARYNGLNNTYEEFSQALVHVEQHLGKEGLRNMHIHVAGINYGPKGEKNHLPVQESDLRYQELCKTWKDFKIAGVVIVESPLMEKDALLLQEVFKKQ